MSDEKKKEEPKEEAGDEAKKLYDRLLRVTAEFENYKKRVAREQAEHMKFSHETLVKELLPVLDDFDRVLEHLPSQAAPEIKGLVDGVHLIHRHFMKALKKFHLEEVPVVGETFDPHLHEAIHQVESGEVESGKIVACHRKGYKIHDRLVRPASVTVAKEKS